MANLDFGNLNSYTSTYLNGEDLKTPSLFTITGADVKTFDDGDRIVLDFAESDKRMTLNKTQFGVLSDMFGTDGNVWLGQQITMYGERLASGKFAGRFTIKIMPPIQPTTTAATTEPPMPDAPMLEQTAIDAAQDIPF